MKLEEFADRWEQEVEKKVENQTMRRVLVKQLEAKFGSVPKRYSARIAGATTEELDGWTERILKVGSIGELLGR